MIDLPTIWFGILCLQIALYILLDGADLGLGLLSLLPKKESEKSLMMQTVGPIWDANETWLVIAAGTLFGAFPLAYSIILNALYIPVMLLLFGLILRAASFEFHTLAHNKKIWSLMFGVGSLMAIVGQGTALGGLLGGITIVDGQFAGGAFDWVTPLTLFITVGVAFSYAVVGYAYLIKKTSHEMAGNSFAHVLVAAGVTFVAFLTATLMLPQMQYVFLSRWSTAPANYLLFAIAGAIGLVSLLLCYDLLRKRHREHLHTLCMIIFVLAMAGMLVGVYPYLIPPMLTIQAAAASEKTLQFMLYGIAPLLPIVLAYNFYLYRVFRRHMGPSEREGY